MARSTERRRAKGAAAASAATADDDPRLQLELGQFRSKAQQNMARLWRSGSLCDVVIVVDGQTFRAHRIVLAGGLDYMHALFCEDRFKDSTEGRVELAEMTALAFELMLEWLYEGKCDVRESDVMSLLEAASRLQCVDLIPTLENAIAGRLGADTCLAVWDAADRMQLSTLAEAAESKALVCYEELVSTKEFNAMPAAKLSRLLASDKLNIESEEAVFDSVVSWAKAQSTPPSDDELGAIFDNVRFPLMSDAFINDHVETEKIVVGSPKVLLSFSGSMKEKAFNKCTKRMSHRQCAAALTWEDMQPGLRVRIKDDLEVVKALFGRRAPGAFHASPGWDDDTEELLGTEHTIVQGFIHPLYRCVSLGEKCWPFDALERA